jgi:3-methyladenine DNA glycosylase/8-oxoguanine DNA glycosylase
MDPFIVVAGVKQHAFPRPEDILRAKAHAFRRLGFSYSKAHSLLDLSQKIVSAKFNPEQLIRWDNTSTVEMLQRLRGVGRWTAEYVLLRGLGRLDTFPGDDVGARNRLARWLGRDNPRDSVAVSGFEGSSRVFIVKAFNRPRRTGARAWRLLAISELDGRKRAPLIDAEFTLTPSETIKETDP